MKKIAALLLLLAFTAQTFSRSIVIFNFYIHQSYIAANQCENRYRPMLHCDGKCQLAKKLKNQEKKEQQNPELKLENKNEVISSRSFFMIDLATPAPCYSHYFNFYAAKPVDRSFTVFHPPCPCADLYSFSYFSFCYRQHCCRSTILLF
jgi:hypothetical protein